MALPTRSGPTDKEIDLSIANMLRVGVSLAAAIVLLGTVLYFVHPRSKTLDYTHFHEAGPSLNTISGIMHGALKFNPFSIIQLGLLALIATPVVRVLFCVIGFARQRDRIYLSISITVLLILLFSLIKAGR